MKKTPFPFSQQDIRQILWSYFDHSIKYCVENDNPVYFHNMFVLQVYKKKRISYRLTPFQKKINQGRISGHQPILFSELYNIMYPYYYWVRMDKKHRPLNLKVSQLVLAKVREERDKINKGLRGDFSPLSEKQDGKRKKKIRSVEQLMGKVRITKSTPDEEKWIIMRIRNRRKINKKREERRLKYSQFKGYDEFINSLTPVDRYNYGIGCLNRERKKLGLDPISYMNLSINQKEVKRMFEID